MMALVGVNISGIPGPPLGPSYLQPHRGNSERQESEANTGVGGSRGGVSMNCTEHGSSEDEAMYGGSRLKAC
jgi:hypothetical protein